MLKIALMTQPISNDAPVSSQSISGSLQSSGLAEQKIFDEERVYKKGESPEVIAREISEYTPDAVVLFRQPQGEHVDALIKSMPAAFKAAGLDVPVVLIWCVLTGDGDIACFQDMETIFDLHVNWDILYPEPTSHQSSDRLIHLPIAQDESVFSPPVPFQNRDRFMCMLGERRGDHRPDRARLIELVEQTGISFSHAGGHEQLTPTEYAELLKRSMCSLCPPVNCTRFSHLRARTMEALSCGVVPLVYTPLGRVPGAPTIESILFKPFLEYIPWNTIGDLIMIHECFTANPNAWYELAMNGYRTHQEKFSSRIFWSTVFEKVGIPCPD